MHTRQEIIDAIQARNIEKNRELVDQNASRSTAPGHSLAVLQALLEHGAPPNAKQQQGWTALHEAAQRGDNDMIALLLKHGADPTVKNDEGVTPVQLAREKGHGEIARTLGAA